MVGTTSPSFSAGSRGNITVGGSGSAIFALQTGGTAKGYVFHDGTEMTVANDANGYIRFNTNATERARIDSSGNFGIGTTTTSGVVGARLYVNGGITMPGNNDISGTSGLAPHYGSGSFIIYSGMPGSGNERARIDTSGNFMVGRADNPWNARFVVWGTGTQVSTIGTASTTARALELNVAANNTTQEALLVYSTSNQLSNAIIYSNGNIVNRNNSYGAISDAKLKENVTDATPKLDKLNQVRVVNFNMIGSEQKQLGVIAQELEQVFPGMVD
jgi:hypothetical protein